MISTAADIPNLATGHPVACTSVGSKQLQLQVITCTGSSRSKCNDADYDVVIVRSIILFNIRLTIRDIY